MTDPGRLFLLSSLAVVSIASLFAAQPAHAQKWLAWRSPATHGNDTAAALTANAATRVTPAPVTALRMVPQSEFVAEARGRPTLTTPASVNSTIAVEPLPTPNAGDTDTMAHLRASGKVANAAIHAEQENACDEISRCDRLEVVRSGVGVEAPKDDAVKRRPENAAKRHVLQSVRAVW